ncbi:MAG: HAD family hydrolase [Nitriliruptoraceae bacterium]
MSGRALLIDYGGVLTVPVRSAFAAFERAQGLTIGAAVGALAAASRTTDGGVIGALERGELELDAFEVALREELASVDVEVPTDLALLDGLLAAMQPAGTLWELVAAVRRAGVRTGLLSNSWGYSPYPMDRLRACFDDVVLSGEVGLRKPDPAIYRLAAERLEVEVADCVFVDDLAGNVQAAAELGMVAVHHTGDEAATWSRVSEALGLQISRPRPRGPAPG